MSSLEDFNKIMDWAEYRASDVTKSWLVPASKRVAAELMKNELENGENA